VVTAEDVQGPVEEAMHEVQTMLEAAYMDS